MSARPLCHLLPSLEASEPLCGAHGLMTDLCTVQPALVTCPKCQRAHMVGYPVRGPRKAAARTGDGGMREEDFMAAIRRAARESQWLPYHTHRSEKSEPGFPDLVLVKPGHPLIMAELKGDRGKLTPAQLLWYNTLQQATGIASFIWRPKDLAAILDLLRKSC